MTEAKIQHDILVKYGNDPRLRIWRSNSGAAYTRGGRLVRFNFPGCPDISGFLNNGRAFFIEVKKPGGVQSQQQKAFQQICIKFNAIYIIAFGCEDVERVLNGLL